MLPLSTLAKLAGEEEKGIFPYSILTRDMRSRELMIPNFFKTEEDYISFIEKNGEIIDTFNVLEEYCKNDALITKNSIIKFWKIVMEGGMRNNNRILTAAKLSIINFFMEKTLIRKKIDIKIDRLIRKGYYGGRTEVFGNIENNEILLHFD
jgi:hypothetical protein